MLRKFLTLSILGLMWTSVHCMTVDELIHKMASNYEGASQLEYTSSYELFKGYSSTEVYSSYNGYVYRNKGQVYQKIDETEFVYGTDYFLKIGNKEKVMLLDLAQKNINLEVDTDEVLKNCSQKNMEDKGEYYLVTLVYKPMIDLPFSTVKMRIHKTKFQLLQLDLYYRGARDFSTVFGKKDEAKPHLRIKFRNITMSPKDRSELFQISRYISNTNNRLSPAGKCNGYELVDHRVK